MNPSLQLLLVLLISFEVSFTSRLTANLVFLVITISSCWPTAFTGASGCGYWLAPSYRPWPSL